MVYTEENRLAVYTGGVTLERPNLQGEIAATLHAYLAESERGFAAREGVCRWRGGDPPDVAGGESRTTGTAEHSEYYTADQKVILTRRLAEDGGQPRQHHDRTRRELTYFANDDRLLVNGADGQPAHSRLIRETQTK